VYGRCTVGSRSDEAARFTKIPVNNVTGQRLPYLCHRVNCTAQVRAKSTTTCGISDTSCTLEHNKCLQGQPQRDANPKSIVEHQERLNTITRVCLKLTMEVLPFKVDPSVASSWRLTARGTVASLASKVPVHKLVIFGYDELL
jgi:hypothetical protein